MQVRSATRAPGVRQAGDSGSRGLAEGLPPATCCQAGPPFPYVACTPPHLAESGLSALGLLLTDRGCVAGAALCSTVPPLRHHPRGWGDEDATPGPPLCGLTFLERAHPLVRET